MTNCPVCSSEKSTVLFKVKDIPTYCNLLWETEDSAINCPKGDIQLEFCQDCGHVHNSAFDPSKMDYTQSYENSLHFSPRFQKFAEGLAESLIKKHNIKQKNILEIGCGKGDFLKIICEKGSNIGTGFDKSYDPKLESPDEKVDGVTFVQDWYSKKYSDVPVDFLLCRHVLEHIEQPAEFVKEVKSILGDKEVEIYFEVPNILYTLRDLGIWDLIYEHCGYFTPNSLSYLFKKEGFNVLHVEEKYGNQFLGIEASNKSKQEKIHLDFTLSDLSKLADNFSNAYTSKVEKWEEKIKELSAKGQKMVVWGGGSKGVTFLNILKSKGEIEAIVDINPRKQGKYVAGTGHKFIGPEELKTINPHLVIIMNPIYKDEIKSSLNSFGLNPDIIAENEL